MYYSVFPLISLILLSISTLISADYYKKYLIICEYLQINPSVKYGLDFIYKRVEDVLSLWNENESNYNELKELAAWFKKNYNSLIGIWYGFSKKTSRLLLRKKFCIYSNTISDAYVKKPLTQNNYESYKVYYKKTELITLIISIPLIILVVVLLIALI